MKTPLTTKYFATPEFDYVKLVDLLRSYQSPRDRISKLIKSKQIVRVKKGLYVLGSEFGRPYSRLILANLIYGPSYVSGLSALSYYQMIPERLECTYSTTPQRNKSFATPAGKFIYSYLALEKYQVSVTQAQIEDMRFFLIATPEKALVEVLLKAQGIERQDEIADWLSSMRIESSSLLKLRAHELSDLARVFANDRITWLKEFVMKEKRYASSRS